MTIEEFYASMGVDVHTVLRRLGTEERVRKYLIKMIDDASFSELESALKEGRCEDAFRAAHSLKGICINLDFLPLMRSCSLLVETLRAGNLTAAFELIKPVEEDYRSLISALRELTAN